MPCVWPNGRRARLVLGKVLAWASDSTIKRLFSIVESREGMRRRPLHPSELPARLENRRSPKWSLT